MASNQDQASAVAEVEAPKARFPPCVVLIMIRSAPDYMMPYMWCTFRLVCKTWKVETEKAFREIYLSKAKLLLMPEIRELKAQYVFHRLSQGNNQERAFFRIDFTNSNLRDLFPSMRQRPMTTLYRRDGSMYFIAVDNVAISDPALEKFYVDSGNGEVSFLWMPMMNQLMGEEFHLRREACKAVDRDYAKSQEGDLVSIKDVQPDFESQRKKITFYMAQRESKFLDVINQARESRLQKQYEICGDTFIPSEKFYGVYARLDETYIIWKMRQRFRVQGYLLEF
ncbi:hypothetical protein F4806DRAFT_504348 [Annulohypoxylon nitens]|nr:hypothetical protein F4806DRAFT_504348 [Annulohypoxylon nitens]